MKGRWHNGRTIRMFGERLERSNTNPPGGNNHFIKFIGENNGKDRLEIHQGER